MEIEKFDVCLLIVSEGKDTIKGVKRMGLRIFQN